jgi:uncharacterized protein (TIGR02466 family)
MPNYKNILENTIFTNFVLSCEPNVSLEKLKKECLNLKEEFIENFNYTKKTNSYLSPNFDDKNLCGQPELEKLLNIVCDFSQNELNKRNFNISLSSYWWWVSVNEPNGHMRIHTHGKADLIAIFHVNLPKDGGELVLVRNDGSSYGNLYKNKPNENTITIESQPGRLYLIPGHIWHLVNTNKSDESRISISYNLFFNK